MSDRGLCGYCGGHGYINQVESDRDGNARYSDLELDCPRCGGCGLDRSPFSILAEQRLKKDTDKAITLAIQAITKYYHEKGCKE